jgi:hypothetical protein
MSDKTTTTSFGCLPWACFFLFVAFLVLRLCGVIAWSWWWVTAPLWGYLLFLVVSVGCVLGLALALVAFAALVTAVGEAAEKK